MYSRRTASPRECRPPPLTSRGVIEAPTHSFDFTRNSSEPIQFNKKIRLLNNCYRRPASSKSIQNQIRSSLRFTANPTALLIPGLHRGSKRLSVTPAFRPIYRHYRAYPLVLLYLIQGSPPGSKCPGEWRKREKYNARMKYLHTC